MIYNTSLKSNKGRILLYLTVLLLNQSCATHKFNGCSNKKACSEIEKKLEIISDFIFFSKGNVDSVVKSAKYMEKLSGHKSEAEIQYDGQDPPTMNDYYTWTAWYSVNHNKL